MRVLLDNVFAEVPKAVVVISTLLPVIGNQANIDDINNQYRKLAEEYSHVHAKDEPEFKVILADMADGVITADDLYDGTHPDTLGQRKMAAVWEYAIRQASERGWIEPPSDSGMLPDGDGASICKKKYGGSDRAGQQVLFAGTPSIEGDGPYKHESTPRPDIGGEWEGDTRTMRMFFAQIVSRVRVPKGSERDEAIFVTGNGAGRQIWYELNNGDGTFDDLKIRLDVGMDCDAESESEVEYPVLERCMLTMTCRYALGRCRKCHAESPGAVRTNTARTATAWMTLSASLKTEKCTWPPTHIPTQPRILTPLAQVRVHQRRKQPSHLQEHRLSKSFRTYPNTTS